MRIGWFHSPQVLRLFMVYQGLHSEIVVHPKDLELLGKGEVCIDHVMDLNRRRSVFIKPKIYPIWIPLVLRGIPPL